MSSKKINWEKYLEDCMQSTDYCCIATVDKKGVWANPVYFAWDNAFTLYFISQPHSRHMQNLRKDSRISVAIYKTEQKGDVIGVQLEGKAHIIEKEVEKSKARKVYYGRLGSLDQNESLMDDSRWLFVKIIPEDIYYFNSEIFGEERQKVSLNEIKNG